MKSVITLPIGKLSLQIWREKHAFEARSIHMLQTAVTDNILYLKYSSMIDEMDPINIRDLLDFKKNNDKNNSNTVEPSQEIRKRLVAIRISLEP